MDADYWNRLETIFSDALALPDEERAPFLDAACSGNDALRLEVEQLLTSHEDAHALAVESRLLAGDGKSGMPDPMIGSAIGPYRIVEVIGRGGMGTVYRAIRDDGEFEQQVALKLIRPGLGTTEMIARFRLERQLLARLSHPNITQLLDGGVSPDGRPFLVMQYITGVPITAYCDANRLSIDERLGLFRNVCDAVQHAHRNLVVHRDIKPSNILVTDEGVVKLMDFGIAKLLQPDAIEPNVAQTQTELRLMTPEYAAPEQFRGDSVTTATDVYSLGILLYELLSGLRPYNFEKRLRAEVEHAICDVDPPRPSTALTQHGNEVPGSGVTTAQLGDRRRLPVGRLKRVLEGDLDNIVMMALRKEPERRYASAGQFAEEIARYEQGQPVIARKDTLGYRTKKFVRRNRVAVLTAGTAVVFLAGFAAVTATQAGRLKIQSTMIASERDRATEEADKANEVIGFIEDLFKSADPYEQAGARGDTLLVRDFLAASATRVQEALETQPVVKAKLLDVLGTANRNIGDLETARTMLETALGLQKVATGSDSVSTLDMARTTTSLALLLRDQSDYVRAESLLAIVSAYYDRNHPELVGLRAKAVEGHANTLQDLGRFDEALEQYRKSVALQIEAHGEEDRRVATARMNLATILVRRGELAEAEVMMRDALVVQERELGSEHPEVASARNNLAYVLADLGQLDEAEQLYLEVLRVRRLLFESPHPQIAITVNNLAYVYMQRQELDKAEQFYRESLSQRRQLYGARNPRTANVLINLGVTLSKQGKHAEAIDTGVEGRDIFRETLGAEHPGYADATANLAKIYHAAGKHGLAVTLFTEALAIRKVKLPENHPATLNGWVDLAECLTETKQFAQAEAELLEVLRRVEAADKQPESVYNAARDRLASLYDAWGKPEPANSFR